MLLKTPFKEVKHFTRKCNSMTANTVSVESDLCLTSCLHSKYHCKLRQSWQLCKTIRCIYSILLKSIWENSITQMLQQKNRVNGSKIKVFQRPHLLKFLNLMPLRCMMQRVLISIRRFAVLSSCSWQSLLLSPSVSLQLLQWCSPCFFFCLVAMTIGVV